MKIKGLVALTGASGSGKSVASSFFRDNGVAVIDGDMVARKVQTKGSPCLSDLAEAFSGDILFDNGELNRKKLGAIVFSDKAKLQKLNEIVHPYVVNEIISNVKDVLGNGKPFCIVEAPALIESGLIDYCDKVVCIETDRDNSAKRIQVRDNLSPENASNRLKSQLSNEQYRQISDLVVLNNGSIEEFNLKLAETIQEINSWYK